MDPIIIQDIDKGRGEVIRLEISEYKGKKYVNIRTWYTDPEGKLSPTKKGVALTLEQFQLLKSAFVEVENKLTELS